MTGSNMKVKHRSEPVEIRAAVPAITRPAFEYRVHFLSCAAEDRLNALGSEGWELVAVLASPGDRAAYYLKRAL